MTPLLLTPPAVEPLTLAEAKAWLRIDGAEDDALVASLIGAAPGLVEPAPPPPLIHHGCRIIRDGWPVDGRIPLPMAPVAEVTAVRVLDSAGLPAPVPATAYRLEALRDPPLVIVTGAVPLPGQALSGIEIDVIAGFGPASQDVPEPLRHAVRLLLARWYEQRGDAAGDELALPGDIAALIGPYRRPRV